MRVVVLTLLFALTWSGSHTEDCPHPYPRYSKDYTFCKPPNDHCTISKQGVSAEDKKVILGTHNDLRNKIATGNENRKNLPKSANHMQIGWDEELARGAQAHANQCAFDHDCGACRLVENFGYGVGQNLAESSGHTSPPKPDWKGMITMWNDEIKDFDPQDVDPFRYKDSTGHFTQVQWADTWKVGCGFTVYATGSTYKTLYTCNYGPAGNGEGKMYQAGNPCSQCPLNTKCSEEYSGLCVPLTDQGPQQPPPPADNLFYCDFKTGTTDCERSVVGTDGWQIRNTYSVDYITIVLNGGETSELKFTNPVRATHKGSICLRFLYCTGPDKDGDDVGNGMTLKIHIPGLQWTSVSKLVSNDHTSQWTKFSFGMGWGDSSEVSFVFEAAEDAPKQYLDLADILATGGDF